MKIGKTHLFPPAACHPLALPPSHMFSCHINAILDLCCIITFGIWRTSPQNLQISHKKNWIWIKNCEEFLLRWMSDLKLSDAYCIIRPELHPGHMNVTTSHVQNDEWQCGTGMGVPSRGIVFPIMGIPSRGCHLGKDFQVTWFHRLSQLSSYLWRRQVWVLGGLKTCLTSRLQVPGREIFSKLACWYTSSKR